MRKLYLLLPLLLLLFPQPSFSQTASYKLTWDQPLPAGQTFTDVQAYSWTLKVGTGTPTVVLPVCINGTTITCTVPVPTQGPSYTITAINGFGSASGTVSGTAPSGPVNIKVVVTVTVP